MRVIIAGSRGFNDYVKLSGVCDFLLQDQTDIEIVSGTAYGADQLGERYAKERGYPVKQFPADWVRHKKAAGYIRNEEMAEYGDMLIAFWDGESKGTKHMINLAIEHGLKLSIKKY
jgi:hypothetical protein